MRIDPRLSRASAKLSEAVAEIAEEYDLTVSEMLLMLSREITRHLAIDVKVERAQAKKR